MEISAQLDITKTVGNVGKREKVVQQEKKQISETQYKVASLPDHQFNWEGILLLWPTLPVYIKPAPDDACNVLKSRIS